MHYAAGDTATPAVLQHLRAATAGRHAALEAQLQLAGALTLPRYIRVLQGFHAFLAAWEPLVQARLPGALQAWFSRGRRGQHAADDLRALGGELPAAAKLSLALRDESALLGSIYVIEGSALGAQVIAPMLREQLGLQSHNGAAYFALPAAAAGGRWREFRALLAERATDAASASQAAADTFDALAAVFRGCAIESTARA
jgi:heme oxygenase